jgi:hypothetical protein
MPAYQASMAVRDPFTGARLIVNGELSIDESQFFCSSPRGQHTNQATPAGPGASELIRRTQQSSRSDLSDGWPGATNAS